MRRYDVLFNTTCWHDVQEDHIRSLEESISSMDGDRMLNTPVSDLRDYYAQEYRIDIPVLREDEIVADQREAEIDVSHDPLRGGRFDDRPIHVTGTEVEIVIPFDGDPDAFAIQPSTYSLNPPMGDVRDARLTLRIQGVDLNAGQVKKEVDGLLTRIREYLATLRTDAQKLNDTIPERAVKAIERRRAKLLADRNLVASLGFALKARGDSAKTFVASQVRRKVKPCIPEASEAPFQPEPELAMDDYAHILEVIQNMAQVMERSPSAFTSMDEESLRTHFLVQLNGHYEGQATGETFNYEGKTDILIRVDDKNIFIGECKFWDGPKSLTSAIDQLLSYSSWKDTKVAIMLFSRRKSFSDVLDAIPAAVQKHPSLKRDLGMLSETSFRYVLAHRDDPSREMILTILAFDVPMGG